MTDVYVAHIRICAFSRKTALWDYTKVETLFLFAHIRLIIKSTRIVHESCEFLFIALSLNILSVILRCFELVQHTSYLR